MNSIQEHTKIINIEKTNLDKAPKLSKITSRMATIVLILERRTNESTSSGFTIIHCMEYVNKKRDIATLQSFLSECKNNKTTHITYALLTSAVAIGCIVSVVLGALYAPPILCFLGAVGYALTAIITGAVLLSRDEFVASKAPDYTCNRPYISPGPLLSLFGGVLIWPLYQVLTHESTIQSAINNLEKYNQDLIKYDATTPDLQKKTASEERERLTDMDLVVTLVNLSSQLDVDDEMRRLINEQEAQKLLPGDEDVPQEFKNILDSCNARSWCAVQESQKQVEAEFNKFYQFLLNANATS